MRRVPISLGSLWLLGALGCATSTPPVNLTPDGAADETVTEKDVDDAASDDAASDDAASDDVVAMDVADASPDDVAVDAPPVDATLDATPDDVADAAPDVVCRAMCMGSCTDTDTDPRNCGGCGVDCATRPGVDPSRVRCMRGLCDFTNACMPGRANCSGLRSDGCETVVTTATRCGGCTTTCAEPTPLCGMTAGAPGGYACVSGCAAPTTARCGATCVNTDNDVRNCGACGNICASGGTAATPSCMAGRCQLACITGYGNCDGNAANGCETLTRSSALHCGACGNACPAAPNATPLCSAGTCTLTCMTGWGNCDGNLANGCETNLATTVANCGACGNACAARANSTASCAASACVYTCATGFGNCDGLTTNGCEADLHTNPLNCGACARRCATAANATPACAADVCGITCTAGYADCNHLGTDGCESPVQTDPRNCGACGTVCPDRANATGSCTASRCGVACATNFGNCDGDDANGCETTLQTSMANCGACGVACNAPSNATAACVTGRCQITCDAGFLLSGSTCVRSPPRGVAPTSTGFVSSRRPTFRVALPPGQDGARVEVCGDRACTSVATTFSFTGASGRPGVDLVAGTYFWRARGRMAGVDVSLPGTATPFTVATGNTPAVDGSWGTALDYNGDGYADLMVGAPGQNRVVYYPGNTSVFSSSGYSAITGTTSFGTAAASAGDVNGDGYGDAVIGAPSANTAYVYVGNGSSLTLGSTLTAPAGVTGFGGAVSAAGDVNGDGYGDVLVGAPGSNRVFLYRGAATGVDATPVSIATPSGASNFGIAVAGVGDVNADGYSDVVIGTDGNNQAYLYLGGAAGLPAAPSLAFTSAGASGFGRAVAPAGDTNNDGYPDVIVGAYNAARAYVFHGNATSLDSTASEILSVGTDGLQFGYTVDGLGDTNGDGYTDVIVGAALSDRAYVFHGGATGLVVTAPAVTVAASGTAASAVGRAVSRLGDANRDGRMDYVVGAPTRNQALVYRGAATVSALYLTLSNPYGLSGSFGNAVAWLFAPRRASTLDPS